MIQAKLQVNQPGDKYEQEADRAAEEVMRMPDAMSPHISYSSPAYMQVTSKPAEEEHLQTREAHSEAPTVSPSVESHINSLRSGGQPLSTSVRAYFEPRFGYDFGEVRVHTDGRAAESARAVNALAYTLGRDVVFGSGQYAPETSNGRKLLAHELAHIVQQRGSITSPGSQHGLIHRAPDKPSGSTPSLPWKHGDHSLFEETKEGIRFLVGVSSSDTEKAVRGAIPSIAKQIATDNKRINDSAFQVKTCFIVSTTTRFALHNGDPVLMLDPADANVDTVAHEMGHAIFHYLSARGESKEPDATKAKNFRLRISDIYLRLASTKEFTEGDETHPAGLWIVDPSQWKPGSKKEHPWDDPDEFFASAKEAYQRDLAGLKKSIARFKKFDSKVGAPADELIALLDAFLGAGKLPSKGLSETRATKAEEELKRTTRVSKVEDTVMRGTLLQWLLDPDSRPKREKAKPSITSP
ncbi:MAG: DUF4157 domain-containing protein [Acidobacteria bacterium]|nr:DUF4157 domain-containing protein [Acidobacteriota bacterium]